MCAACHHRVGAHRAHYGMVYMFIVYSCERKTSHKSLTRTSPRTAGPRAHCEKWLRKSATCWKRLAEAHYARMKSYYTAVSTSAAVLVGMLTL